MALGIKCDRCKKFMDMSNATYSSNFRLKYYTFICDCNYLAYNRTFHLCDSCYEMFINEFLNNESEEGCDQ